MSTSPPPTSVTPAKEGEVHRVRVGGPLPAPQDATPRTFAFPNDENVDAARAHLKKSRDALIRQLALVDAALAGLG